MSRKRQTHRKVEMIELGNALTLNGMAIQEGPKRKNWSPLDLKVIKPLTYAQDKMLNSWNIGFNINAHGSAGTGKTFYAIFLALTEILNKNQSKLVIVRSAVPSREIGFTPGTAQEKMEVYEAPYHDIFHEIVGKASTYQDMKSASLVEFVSTSFIRGVTLDNAIIVFDEIQNASWEEINTVLTRVGKNTRIITCGDVAQNDLHFRRNDTSGIPRMLRVMENMDAIDTITFTHDDIVRSDFVKEWIVACDKVG